MSRNSQHERHEIEGIIQIDARELQSILDDHTHAMLVVDVREPEEYDERHIPGIPLIPMGEILEYIDQFDKQREYVLVCRSNRRSQEVAKYFRRNGIDQAYNFNGGMLSWTGQVTTGLERIATSGYAQELERKPIR